MDELSSGLVGEVERDEEDEGGGKTAYVSKADLAGGPGEAVEGAGLPVDFDVLVVVEERFVFVVWWWRSHQ